MVIKLSRFDGQSNLEALQDGLQRFIVRPANAFGLGGFVFGVEGETTIRQESEITDHYVEDNSVVQDHIAIRPVTITLQGYVGELLREAPVDPLTETQRAVRKLTVLNEYLPLLTQTARLFVNGLEEDATFEDLTQNALNLWELTKNLNPSASEQQKAFLYFQALQNQGLLVSVQTPFRFFQNMAIETLVARQTEETNQISDFSITFKQIRIASTETVALDASQLQSRAELQAQGVDELGRVQGENVNVSTVQGFINGITGG